MRALKSPARSSKRNTVWVEIHLNPLFIDFGRMLTTYSGYWKYSHKNVKMQIKTNGYVIELSVVSLLQIDLVQGGLLALGLIFIGIFLNLASDAARTTFSRRRKS